MVLKKRIAVINYDDCNFEKCGNYLCEKVCPVNRNGKECIVHNKGEKPVISEELCIGCEICQNKCPFNAISIVNIGFNLNEPIHSFGKNSFRIHGIPIPKENNTIGLVGRNGIGKTTIIKILANQIIPNFGKLDEESQKEKVIEYFRGKEAQSFFEKVYAGDFKVAVKPQNIEGMEIQGTVKELLEKVNEKNNLDEIVEELNLKAILHRKANNLSGGEFQKLAIAATCLKEADLYFFDEPTSFLDIRERLRIAKYIKKLGEKKSAIVVEHDMILLDYLSDFVHLIYGKPKVYGLISQLKTTKEGINSYLEGYSKEENYRFRNYPIDFFNKNRIGNKGEKETLVNWPEIKKKMGGFSLNVSSKKIYKNEVVGIVGPNGIGKTTFIKILSGELKPDNTKLENKLKIAYKPQYISYKGEKTVRELFEGNINDIKNTLLKPLEIDSLLEKKLKTLSGGELQRVSIALCLSKKADLYLLDEPSAYLDVEQRLITGKVIRNHISVNGASSLIIDHDLTFLDFVSDRLMVFKGEATIKGEAIGPTSVKEGMNTLLQYLGITVRRDSITKRPRINKEESVLDREQKEKGIHYS